MASPIAVLDVDGTLVDTNYHHAIAWYRAFREHGLTLPVWRIHRHIGMGGDQLVAALAGKRVEDRQGDSIRAAETALYADLIGEVEPFADARRLLELLDGRGHRLVLASSGKRDEIDHYLDLLEARGLVEAWTTSADVERTKPDPDLVVTAIDKVGGGQAVMVGDSTFDCEAAARAEVPAVAILTGGFSDQELRQAGAGWVLQSLTELCERLEETPLAQVAEVCRPGRRLGGRERTGFDLGGGCDAMPKTARDVMTPNAECVGENETLLEAARKMADRGVGSLPICGEDNRLKGMLTDRDIVVKALAKGKDPGATRAGELGEGKPVTIGADDSLAEALQTMANYKVRRLPVIDGHELVGIVAVADIARELEDDASKGDLIQAISEGPSQQGVPSQ